MPQKPPQRCEVRNRIRMMKYYKLGAFAVEAKGKVKLTWRQHWEIDMGVIMRQVMDEDKHGTLYGYLPKMAHVF